MNEHLSTRRIVLTTLLIAYKLDGFIDWSWIWILFPIWGEEIVIELLASVLNFIVNSIDKAKENKAYRFKMYANSTPLYWDNKTKTMYGAFKEKEQGK